MNNTHLSAETSHKDLGILADSSLKFLKAIVSKATGLDNKLKSTMCHDPDFTVSLYISHIRPLVGFGSIVWNIGYHCDLKLLESVQHKWTKEISGLLE